LTAAARRRANPHPLAFADSPDAPGESRRQPPYRQNGGGHAERSKPVASLAKSAKLDTPEGRE
jgi:hypothetical protein